MTFMPRSASGAQPGEPRFAAIVLAGGAGRRLGGVDKAALDVGGRTLLERALAAVAEASETVVVGPPRRVPPGVVLTREEPPGSGPVAAIAAGLDAITGDPPLVVVLACDMPFFDATAVSRLMAAAHALDDLGTHSDGVVFVDAEGRRQLLAAAYRTVSLRAALDALDEVTDTAVRDLAKRLTLVEIAADPETTLDCDTWTDVQRSHDALEER